MSRIRMTLPESVWIMGIAILASGVSYWLTPWHRQPPPEVPLSKQAPSVTGDTAADPSNSAVVRPLVPPGRKTAGRPIQSLEGRFPQQKGHPVRKIQLADATLAFRLKAVFLDARRTDSFVAGHIKGAHAVPVWEEGVRERVRAFIASWGRPASTPVVVYCAGGACEDAELLAAYLVREGLLNVLIYEGGFQEWETQGQLVEVGE